MSKKDSTDPIENNFDIRMELLTKYTKDPKDLSAEDIEQIRSEYKEYLTSKAKNEKPVGMDDVYHIYNQFCNYGSMQMMSTIAQHIYKDDANNFLYDMIDNFITQTKTNLYRGYELQELKQQNTAFSKIIGQDILDIENKQSRNRINQIIQAFRTQVIDGLMLEDEAADEDGEEEEEGDIF